MTSRKLHASFLAVTAAIFVAGVALNFLPVPVHVVPDFDAGSEFEIAAQHIEQDEIGAFVDMLDASRLPQPASSLTAVTVTPPEPADQLRRYTYLGGAFDGERAAALFRGDGGVLSLSPGELLAEFVLTRFDGDGAEFRQDDLTEVLPLGER